MNILEQIRKEHPWLETNKSYDLRRGKPSNEQLAFTQSIFESLEIPFHADGIDLRNYGEPGGIPSARVLGSEILGTDPSETLALDNASLTSSSLKGFIIAMTNFINKCPLLLNYKLISLETIPDCEIRVCCFCIGVGSSSFSAIIITTYSSTQVDSIYTS